MKEKKKYLNLLILSSSKRKAVEKFFIIVEDKDVKELSIIFGNKFQIKS